MIEDRNIDELQMTINRLQVENVVLKKLLDEAGIPYVDALREAEKTDDREAFDSNQGGRIIHPTEITDSMANRFYAMFWGRQDVYAKRSVNRTTGKAGYFPQCDNFWTDVCLRKGKRGTCANCSYKKHTKLVLPVIKDHLVGKRADASDVIGVYPLLPNGTCRFLVFDFDNHDKGAEAEDFANKDDEWKEEVDAMRSICEMNEMRVLVERSRSGRGAHIWLFFDQPIDARLARRFGFALLEKGAEYVNMKSFKYYDRMLPAQDSLPEGAIGNLIALPLQGKALIDGNSAFIDRNWNAIPDQWATLWNSPKLSKAFLEEKIRLWESSASSEEDDEKPWKDVGAFSPLDTSGTLEITLSNGIYVGKKTMKPALQNKVRRLAAFRNPTYYRNRAMGLSNMGNGSWVYLGEDVGDYIHVPIGQLDMLTEKLEEGKIKYSINDERSKGRKLNIKFDGVLKEEQKTALDSLLEKDNGILHAATAFGKTVVCAAMIAERKTSTLILLESSSLVDQWQEALEKFLAIDEEPPEYETKTGRKRKRKSVIGKLQGAHDSTTGIIDIAMCGSVIKKREPHERLKDYGLVLVDECHHAASDTLSEVLSQVMAKYIYGVTATPKRADGMEKVAYMMIGPIRHSYTAKERAEKQGIGRFVYPRFTRSVATRGSNEKMHPNEAYEIIRNDEPRDDQIVGDAKKCVEEGRTPVILSKYKDHSERLYERLKGYADHVLLMTGNNSKKENRRILDEMQAVGDDETLILVATGKLIGEGFDYPRLDTLIMATPVPFRSVVEQFVGRLDREYPGKENVIVYDYVDSHIPVFDRMYAKRIRAYKQIGYGISGGENPEKIEANAIFDYENYAETYRKDLRGAARSIIISSPAIAGKKVSEMTMLLKERQQSGVRVTVVTWAPDSYGYGKSDYWMELHEEMRCSGFDVQLTEDFCEHYTIIDDEVVWYGSMNFLSKEDAEDNLMRVESRDIANELKELTFGAERNIEKLN